LSEQPNSLSVVIPALDEPYLNTLMKEIDDVLKKSIMIDKWEIIIKRDVGCGNAICRGIEEASYNIVVVMDGDGSHNPLYIPRMYWWIKKQYRDISYGYKKQSYDSLYRKIVTFCFDRLTRFVVRDAPDLLSGFFMIDKSKVKYPIMLEHPKVLLRIIKSAETTYLIEPIPIVFEKRKKGESKLGNWKTAIPILKEIFISR
jgi:dolichol-phosphate mannosyltransferase